jgi:hypothetical protein
VTDPDRRAADGGRVAVIATPTTIQVAAFTGFVFRSPLIRTVVVSYR